VRVDPNPVYIYTNSYICIYLYICIYVYIYIYICIYIYMFVYMCLFFAFSGQVLVKVLGAG